MDDNLFTVLHKWARRQDENFCTDAFAHLLRHLCKSEPDFACDVLAKLTDDWLRISPDEIPTVTVTTQVTAEQDRPDLVIRTHDRLAFVEVKMESEPREIQLKRYRHRLTSSGFAHTRLVLLTRYPPKLSDSDAEPDFDCRWHQVADWLSEGLNSGPVRNEVTVHLVR